MKSRIIEKLRVLFPNKTWKYENQHWVCDTFEVFGESHNYDECTGYHTVHYRRTDTNQLISALGFKRELCD